MSVLTRFAGLALCMAVLSGVSSAQPTASSTISDTARSSVQWYNLGAHGRYGYTPPRFLQSLRNAPGTIGRTVSTSLHPSAVGAWGLVAVSTAATIAADEWLLDETRSMARAVDLPPNHPSVNVRVGGLKLVPLPTTLGSAIYFLGDGAVSLGVAGGFMAVGAWKNDNRASRTASQITESLLAAGTFTQVIKHMTGRQTPSEATVARGRWNWFPSWSEYNANVPGHDAFPSGHLAVATATVEVIAQNYPEKRLVRPVGYSLLTALSFAMVNNGVHWASDYPLAIAIGRTVATQAVSRGRINASGNEARAWQPLIGPGVVGVSFPIGR
ncbi:MAG: phosphatase PAP2 family protein [Gemmatimonadaceae bacterium]